MGNLEVRVIRGIIIPAIRNYSIAATNANFRTLADELKNMSSVTFARGGVLAHDFNLEIDGDVLAADSRYSVRLARNNTEVASALRLRHDVFKIEMKAASTDVDLEFDAYDFRSKHLLVIERITGSTIGTYRLNSISCLGQISLLYSQQEFRIDQLPPEVLLTGVEVGRACIAAGHRNTKALFTLWKGLARYLLLDRKRYLFGCCSIFTRDPKAAAAAYLYLAENGHLHPTISIFPRKCAVNVDPSKKRASEPVLPQLFQMYLRLGAKVCGPPMIDHSFGTIDFFVLFDLEAMSGKYRRVFLG